MNTLLQCKDPYRHGLVAVYRALQTGAVTSLDLVEAALARIDLLESRLQAFTHLDHERSRELAHSMDQLRASGVNLGPLMGLPIAVKDLFSVDGMPTTSGSRIDIQALVPPQGSFVNALNRAGCIVLGKTRTTEFALGGYNPTQTLPWNPADSGQQRMTGGSSHGSTVAMAAGLAAFTVGSDTGGSVRWPAAQCGVVGYKASASHWPCDGVFPLSPQMDSLGIFTRSASDAAWIEAALGNRRLRAPIAISALTLAWPVRHFMENLDPVVAGCFAEAMNRLRRAGVQIVEIDVPEAAEVDAVFRCLVPVDLMAFLGREKIRLNFDRLDPVAAQRLEAAMAVSAIDYAQMAARQRLLAQVMRERSVGADAWIMPTVPVLPEPVAAYSTVEAVANWNRLATQNTRPANLFSQCGISLPIHHLSSTLPVGLQLCAPSGEDESLLQTAMAIESLLGTPPAPALDAFVN